MNLEDSELRAPKTAGWGFPNGSKKAHFFNKEMTSLCRSYGYFKGPVEVGQHDHKDNCARCKKKVKALIALGSISE